MRVPSGLIKAAMVSLACLAAYAAVAVAARVAIAWIRGFPPDAALKFVLWRFSYLGGQTPWDQFQTQLSFPLLFLLAAIPIEILGLSLAPERRPRSGLWTAAAATALATAVYAWSVGVTDCSRQPYSFTPGRTASDCRSGRCVPLTNNALGFRGPVLSPARRPGYRRLLLIGDSFIYGSGIEDSATLDAALLRRLSPGWEVGSFAIPGFNLRTYARLAEAVVPTYAPDVVVVGFLGGVNDVLQSDYWEIRDSLGPLLWGIARVMDMTGEIFVVHSRHDVDAYGGSVPKPIAAKHSDAVDRLLELRRKLGFELVIFSYFGPSELFAPAQKRGELVQLSPKPWRSDPALAFSHNRDGHPTGAANELFAEQLAGYLKSH